jgi:phospholipid/cholesterol/gamma-HCH transport system substrate-binding protein
MKQGFNREVRAGIFLLVTLGALVTVVLAISARSGLFTKQASLFARFEDVSGLVAGAPVMLQGIRIGTVAEISIARPDNGNVLVVRMDVNKKYLSFIRDDSIASIQTMGLLGDKYVNLSMGSETMKAHKDGDTVASVHPPDIYKAMARGSEILDNLSAASASLNDILVDIRENARVVSFSKAVEEARQLLHDIRTNEGGSVHSLIYGDALAKAADNLKQITQDISKATAIMHTQDNLMHSLIYDKSGARMLSNLEGVTRELSEILGQAKKGGTFLNALLAEDGEGKKMLERLSLSSSHIEQASKNLDVTLKALAQGKGTLGALIHDPSLYDSIVVVMDGAKRSFILKKAVQHAVKKSLKAMEQEED